MVKIGFLLHLISSDGLVQDCTSLLRWFLHKTEAFSTEQCTTPLFELHMAFLEFHPTFMCMCKNGDVTTNFWTGATCSKSVECCV